MIKKIRSSFFGKIFAGYMIILFLTISLITYAVTAGYGRFIEDKTIRYNTEILSFIVQTMDKYIMKIDQVLYSIYQPGIFRDFFREDENSGTSYEKLKRAIGIDQYVRQNIYFNDLQEDISGVVIYKNDDSYFYIGNGGIRKGVKFSEMEWYKDFVKNNKDVYVIGPHEEDYLRFKDWNTDSSKQVVFYIKRINLPRNTSSKDNPAFIMLSIKFQKIEELFSQFLRNDKSGIMIINNNNEAVYSRNIDPKLENQLENEIELLLYPKVKKVKSPGGEEILLTSYFIKGFEWRIVCVDYKNAMLADVKPVVNTIYLILFIGGIAAVVLSVFISYGIVNPVKKMNMLMKKVENGNFSVSVDVRSQDEIGQLGSRFNIMVRKINELIQKVYVSELKEKEAKIEALQAQINPHFLFNTLENINCIAQIEGVEVISNLSQSLSKMFRYSIQDGIRYVTIMDELLHVRNFMYIINVRFDNKIEYIEDIDSDILEYKTIKLLLQPIIENSIRHGVARRISNQGVIRLTGKKCDNSIEITVSDDGVGIESQNLHLLQSVLAGDEEAVKLYKPTSSGIGLKNVQDRLVLMFGEEWGLSIKSEENKGTDVIIRFPATK